MDKLAGGIPLAPEGGFRGSGPLGLEDRPASQASYIFNRAISTIVGVMTVVALIWFTFQFIIGAIGIITSGGDKAALESAKKKLTTGIVGVVIVVVAVFLIDLIGDIIGVDILEGANLLRSRFFSS
jgi:hypothetical protein